MCRTFLYADAVCSPPHHMLSSSLIRCLYLLDSVRCVYPYSMPCVRDLTPRRSSCLLYSVFAGVFRHLLFVSIVAHFAWVSREVCGDQVRVSVSNVAPFSLTSCRVCPVWNALLLRRCAVCVFQLICGLPFPVHRKIRARCCQFLSLVRGRHGDIPTQGGSETKTW